MNKLFQVHDNPRNDKRYLFELIIQNLECSTIKSLIEIANAKTDLEWLIAAPNRMEFSHIFGFIYSLTVLHNEERREGLKKAFCSTKASDT